MQSVHSFILRRSATTAFAWKMGNASTLIVNGGPAQYVLPGPTDAARDRQMRSSYAFDSLVDWNGMGWLVHQYVDGVGNGMFERADLHLLKKWRRAHDILNDGRAVLPLLEGSDAQLWQKLLRKYLQRSMGLQARYADPRISMLESMCACVFRYHIAIFREHVRLLRSNGGENFQSRGESADTDGSSVEAKVKFLSESLGFSIPNGASTKVIDDFASRCIALAHYLPRLHGPFPFVESASPSEDNPHRDGGDSNNNSLPLSESIEEEQILLRRFLREEDSQAPSVSLAPLIPVLQEEQEAEPHQNLRVGADLVDFERISSEPQDAMHLRSELQFINQVISAAVDPHRAQHQRGSADPNSEREPNILHLPPEEFDDEPDFDDEDGAENGMDLEEQAVHQHIDENDEDDPEDHDDHPAIVQLNNPIPHPFQRIGNRLQRTQSMQEMMAGIVRGRFASHLLASASSGGATFVGLQIQTADDEATAADSLFPDTPKTDELRREHELECEGLVQLARLVFFEHQSESPQVIHTKFKLLWFIQRHLVQMVARGWVSIDALIRYGQALISKCNSDVRASESVFALRSSPVTRLLPEFVATTLTLLEWHHFLPLAQPMFHSLQRVNDSVGNLVDRNFPLTLSTVLDSPHPLPETIMVVESQHAYVPTDGVDERCITMGGVSHIVLHFDSRCCTERNSDILEVYTGDNVPIGGGSGGESSCGWHGPSRFWPRHPVVVRGDSVIFRFRSGSSHTQQYWGYRVIVIGVALSSDFLYPHVPSDSRWIFDLHYMLSYATATCGRLMTIGDAPASEEKSIQHWLKSPLFRAGLKIAPPESGHGREDGSTEIFLTKLADGDNSCLAVRFHKFMLQQLPFHGSEICGTPIVDRTIRIFLCATLKHLGLADAAAASATVWDSLQDARVSAAKLTGHLLHVWKMCKKLRRWIVSERQRFQLEEGERRQNEKNDDNDSEDADWEKSHSYDGICQGMLEKASYLLSFDAFIPNQRTGSDLPKRSRSEEDISIDFPRSSRRLSLAVNVSEMRQMARANSSGSNQAISTDQEWKALFNTWTTLQNWILLKESRDSASSLADLIVTFIQSPLPLQDFVRFLELHRLRATHRLEALEFIVESLTKSQSNSARLALLAGWSCPLRSFSPFRLGGHFRRNAEASGEELAAKTRALVAKLCEAFSAIISDDSSPTRLRCAALNALVIELDVTDHNMFGKLGVIETITNLESRSHEHPTLARIAEAAFNQITLDAFTKDVIECPTMLHKQLIDSLTDFVIRSCARMWSMRKQINVDARTYHRIEYDAFKKMSLLVSLEMPKVLLMTIRSKLGALLACFDGGASPRLQKLLLILLRRIIPTVDPREEIVAIGGNAFLENYSVSLADASPAERFIDRILIFIGSMVAISEPSASASVVNREIDVRDGRSTRDLAMDVIMFLRALSHTSSWKSIVEARLYAAVSASDSKMSSPENASARRMSLAAVLTLGGCASRIRVGARVRTQSDGEAGFVVRVDRDTGWGWVLFTSANPKRVVAVELSKLQSIAVVEHAPLSPRLAASLLHLAQVAADTALHPKTSEQDRLRFVREDIARKRWRRRKYATRRRRLAESERSTTGFDVVDQKTDRRASTGSAHLLMKWACATCTFENLPEHQICEICFSPIPPYLVAAPSPAPEGDSDPDNSKPDDMMDTSRDSPDECGYVPCDYLLSQQIRSSVLKAFCMLLLKPGSAKLLIEYGTTLSSLVRMAIKSTDLDEYKSIWELELKEERLQELIYEENTGNVFGASQTRIKTQEELISHSPFLHERVHLPSAFDISSARHAIFLDEDHCSIQCRFESEIDAVSGAVARSNFLIPSSLPAYYFEACILNLGTFVSSSAADAWLLAVGLCRYGIPLDGSPGKLGTYALSVASCIHTWNDSRVVRIPTSARPFVVGDILGCGWDIRRQSLYFTVNGQLIDRIQTPDTSPEAFSSIERVSGQFYPCVWLQSQDAAVSVNMGHKPFAFSFEHTLPELYGKDKANREPERFMSDTLRQRYTKAEDLAMIMHDFPKEICVIALANSGDNMEVAVNWLLENGRRELERMAEDAIRQSARLAEHEQLFQLRGSANTHISRRSSNSVDSWNSSPGDALEDLGQWIISDALSNVGRNRRQTNAATYLDDGVDEAVPIGFDADDSNAAQTISSRIARTLVRQRSDQSDTREPFFEHFRLADIRIGMIVRVCENAHNMVASASSEPFPEGLEGCLALATAVDVNTSAVTVQVYSPEDAVRLTYSVPVKVLNRPSLVRDDPVLGHGVSSERPDRNRMANQMVDTVSALVTLMLRQAIMELLRQWPVEEHPFHPEFFGGPGPLVDLLQLLAAEFLSSGSTTHRSIRGQQGADTPVAAFRMHIRSFLNDLTLQLEESSIPLPLELTVEKYSERSDEYEVLKADRCDGVSSYLTSRMETTDSAQLWTLLTETCVLHWVQAVENPVPMEVYESAHPYEPHQTVIHRVKIPGASRLLVEFDTSRCDLGTDMLTGLAFYRDEACESDRLQFFKGNDSTRYESFIVDSNSFSFKFTSSADCEHWGYKFAVKPLNYRLDDVQAKAGLNFELGCWLLDVFFADIPARIRRCYVSELYHAVIFYVQRARHADKARGLESLIRILLDMHQNPPVIYPDLTELRTLATSMETAMDSADLDDCGQSPLLQAIVELLATVELVSDALAAHNARSGDNTSASNCNHSVFINEISSVSIVVESARYGIVDSDDPALWRDVKQQISELLQQYGGQMLVLPSKLDTVPFLDVKHDKEPLASIDQQQKLLHLVYFLEMQELNQQGIVTVSREKRISRTIAQQTNTPDSAGHRRRDAATAVGAFLQARQQSWFERVVSLSRLTLDVEKSYALPWSLLVEGCQANAAARSYVELVPAGSSITIRCRTSTIARAIVCNDYFGWNEQFTMCAWIYLPSDTSKLHGENAVSESKSIVLLHKGIRLHPGHPSIRLTSSGEVRASVRTPFATIALVTPEPLREDHWTFICVTCSGAEMSIFVDGTSTATKKYEGIAQPNRSPIFACGIPSSFPFGVLSASDLAEDDALQNTGSADSSPKGEVIALVLAMRYYPRWLSGPELIQVMDACKPDDCDNPYSKRMDSKTNNALVARVNVASILKACNEQVELWSNKDRDFHLLEAMQSLQEHWLRERNRAVQHVRLIDAQPYSWQFNSTPQTIEHDSSAHSSNDLLTRIRASSPLLGFVPSVDAAFLRFIVIRTLNCRMMDVLPLVDFTQAGDRWSLAHRLSNLRSLVFFETKSRPWDRVLRLTETGGLQHIAINRPQALRAREKGNDPDGRRSVFGQMFRQLHFGRPSALRCRGRPWSVTYVGEGGQDAGGLFRDSISALCSDMQAPHLPLFVPCANSRGFGDNQEKFVPNPSATSSVHLSMFRFVGKILGIAIRGGNALNLDLPSMVWKPLVGEKLTRLDLKGIDSLCYDVLEKVRNIEKENLTRENFCDYIPYMFTTISSDGREVELKPNGKNEKVTWDNREEFVQLVEAFRMGEFSVQVEAIRRGLATIVPVQLLKMFTWEELELMICGKREINIQYLKSNTKYKPGVKENDPHIPMFWEILEDFSHIERQKFLRFVWGQSRLPFNPDDFTDKFSIQTATQNNDGALPVSHTCFFSLELPRYSTKDIMRKKLLYAINEGISIDTDHAAENIDWDAQ